MESPASSTAEMPPWAYKVLPSVTSPLDSTRTAMPASARCRAVTKPAAPLPMISTAGAGEDEGDSGMTALPGDC